MYDFKQPSVNSLLITPAWANFNQGPLNAIEQIHILWIASCMPPANHYLEGHLLFLENQNNPKLWYKSQHISKQSAVISGHFMLHVNEAFNHSFNMT